MKIALDAGHGSRSGHPHTGAAAQGLVEDEVALDLTRRIGHHLRAAGHETVCTRPDESLVPLAARGRTAAAHGCQVFLSIHCNAGPASAHGAEAYVVEGDCRSRDLAELLLAAVAPAGLANRGTRWDSQSQYRRLRVLRDTYRRMPAVLLEVGFLTSADDARLLSDRHKLELIARAVAECLAR